MKVDAIKHAISALPQEDRHVLASWLNELEYDAWDREMVKDFTQGGRGMALVDKVKREIAEGRTLPLAEGRIEAKGLLEQSRQ